MPATYTLDLKIEALNLLDRHDGDFRLVKERLQVPLKTLRGWRSSEQELRSRFNDRQWRYFSNIKLELLTDMLESSRNVMKKIKSGDHEGSTISQLAYLLITLLNHSIQLERNFEDIALEAQSETEETDGMRYVYEDDLLAFPPGADAIPEAPGPPQDIGPPDAQTEGANSIPYVYVDPPPDVPPPADAIPETPRPPQAYSVREALRRFGIGADQYPENLPPGTGTLLGLARQLSDDKPNRSRSRKRRKKPKRRRHKRKTKAR